MDENNEISNAGTRQIVAREINKAILRHGALAQRRPTFKRAQLVGGHSDAAIRILCDNGRLVTIDSYIAGLKTDPMLRKPVCEKRPAQNLATRRGAGTYQLRKDRHE